MVSPRISSSRSPCPPRTLDAGCSNAPPVPCKDRGEQFVSYQNEHPSMNGEAQSGRARSDSSLHRDMQGPITDSQAPLYHKSQVSDEIQRLQKDLRNIIRISKHHPDHDDIRDQDQKQAGYLGQAPGPCLPQIFPSIADISREVSEAQSLGQSWPRSPELQYSNPVDTWIRHHYSSLMGQHPVETTQEYMDRVEAEIAERDRFEEMAQYPYLVDQGAFSRDQLDQWLQNETGFPQLGSSHIHDDEEALYGLQNDLMARSILGDCQSRNANPPNEEEMVAFWRPNRF